MSLIADLTPLNLVQEKIKFQENQHYNPQFIYGRPFSDKILHLYGLPQEKYLRWAEIYLNKISVLLNQNNSATEKPLSQREIARQTRALFSQLGLDPPIIHWQNIMSIAKRRDLTLIFSKNLPINQSLLQSIFAHEVETHLLRSYNQKLQTLPKETSSQYIRTEEGLATLNSKFIRRKADFSYSCYRYLTCAWAQKHSFADVFAQLVKTSQFSFEHAWNFTLRSKRGLIDTSKPGGFTKDIVYLEGALLVLDWLVDKDHDPHDLYLGKISLEQVPTYQLHAQREGLIFPNFLTEQLPEYQAFFRSCKQQLSALDLF